MLSFNNIVQILNSKVLYSLFNLKCGKIIYFLDYKVVVSNKVEDIRKSTHLILPGVGSYSNAITKVKLNLNLKVIEQELYEKRKPILGICVGMQIMSKNGFEFKKSKGLNWIDGNVVKMKDKPNIVPEIGWNNLIIHSKKNKIAICGIKITTPPIPGIIPSVNKSVKTPAGKLLFAKSDNCAKVPSIKSIGTDAISKID